MATKKYLSYDKLQEYDALIKAKIDGDDASTLSSANEYTDTQIAKIPSVDAYTKTEMDAALEGKADSDHNHDDTYYTETEIDALLVNKSDSTHNHDSVYETKENANVKLEEAKAYTDTQTSGLASTSSVNTSISTHNTSTSAHEDIRALISDLSTAVNNFLDVDDTTTDQLSEVLTLIENNKGTLESLTTTKINVSDIVNNLATNDASKVLSAAQGVIIKGLIDDLQAAVDGKAATVHIHAISDVTNLQDTLDNKSEDGHTHTAAEITDLTVTATELNYMDGVTSNVQAQIDERITFADFPTVEDIDAICGASIVAASEVEY